MQSQTNQWTVDELEELAHFPAVYRRGNRIEIDLSTSPDLTVIDFARLVLLRKRLTVQNLDLRICGLWGRSRFVYGLCEIGHSLPESPDAQSITKLAG